jgi:hypothetical protein
MGCGCKSTGVKKQVTQFTKRNSNRDTQTVTRVTAPRERKQIIIRRPAR